MAVEPKLPPRHAGGCLCGAVRFLAIGPLRPVVACHCHQCRKQSGHFYAMTSVPADRFLLTESESLRWFRASDTAARGFCGTCGSVPFWRPEGPTQDQARLSIAAGAFDGALGVSIERHIFCADKGDYYEIEAGVPQHAAG